MDNQQQNETIQVKQLLEYIGDCPVEGYKYKWIVSDVQRL